MRIALGIEYAGNGFLGWQSQQNGLTVQGTLEGVLSQVADQPIRVVCAGRTDAGVHATGQVVHFDTDAIRPLRAWIAGSNSWLPKTINVCWAEAVDERFHARFTATARRYCYVILNQPMHSAVTQGRATWHRHPLDVALMQQGANHLLGECDFSSFRSSECESRSPNRCIHFINVKRQQDFIFVELQANAFLHHMVRNIVGVLLRVGAGFKSPDWVAEVLLARDRTAAAETAAADGLYFVQVIYPPPYSFAPGRNVLLF